MTKHRTHQQRAGTTPLWELPRIELTIFVGLLVIFYVHARHFAFIQDDSFITFRYVRNAIQGHGLVWNVGEHVEGYTTFLWTVILMVPALLGIDLVAASQFLGIVSGLFVLAGLFRLSRFMHVESTPRLFGLVAVLLVVVNSAFAYWSISGMETALFTALVVFSALLFLRERKSDRKVPLTPILFVLLSITRPEGMLLFGLTMVYYAVTQIVGDRGVRAAFVKKFLWWSVLFLVPIGVFTVVRYWYYGYLFPNTYYAKAGISAEYFKAGLTYLTSFAEMYLWWGVLMIVPLVALVRRGWKSDVSYFAFVFFAYTAYIVTVGGDVLPAFRFFVPMVPFLYLLVQEGTIEIYHLLGSRRSGLRLLLAAIVLLVALFTYNTPYDHIREYWARENGLVQKMTETGRWIKSHSTASTVIAASTIGAIGYFSDVTLVDMLGLTDETIAHHPEQTFGVKSGWRERNYNVTYVLSRKPDWILFSTGMKPSAFAERALFTHREFRRWYYPYYYHPSGDAQYIDIVYRRSATPLPLDGIDTTKVYDNDFINQFYEGMNRSRRWPNDAIPFFRKTIEIGPPDFALVYQELGGILQRQNNLQESRKYYERALMIDPRLAESQATLGMLARSQGDLTSAKSHFEALTMYQPEYTGGWMYLGEVYLLEDRRDSAKVAFQRSLDLTPNNSEAYRYLQQTVSPR